jgi:multidrug transporter EmrE-like cation transporter
MMTHHTETPMLKRDSLHTISEYIWIATQGFGYSLAALSLYAIPMGIAYFIFQGLFN